jgi:cyanophycinase-like exopeptidase
MSTSVPVYLLAGGRWHNFETILREIFKQAGVRAPRIAYIGAANAEHQDFFTKTQEALLAAGADQVRHVRIGSPDWQKICQASDVIFVSGGDVAAGMEVLRRAKAVSVLRGLHQAGKIFIGVSAGSIILARQWLVWPDEHDEERVLLFPCLGIADVLCDAHDEPEWAELKALLAHMPAKANGMGLRSGSAVAVYGKEVKVIAGKVDTVEIHKAQVKSPE